MNDSEIDPELERRSFLSGEWLEVKRIVNLARGAPIKEWPITDPLWFRRLQDLAMYVGSGAIKGGQLDQLSRFHSVQLTELQKWAETKDERWGWLREFCREWAEVAGVTSPSKKQGNRRAYWAVLLEVMKVNYNELNAGLTQLKRGGKLAGLMKKRGVENFPKSRQAREKAFRQAEEHLENGGHTSGENF